jgi:hypothetical protein
MGPICWKAEKKLHPVAVVLNHDDMPNFKAFLYISVKRIQQDREWGSVTWRT